MSWSDPEILKQMEEIAQAPPNSAKEANKKFFDLLKMPLQAAIESGSVGDATKAKVVLAFLPLFMDAMPILDNNTSKTEIQRLIDIHTGMAEGLIVCYKIYLDLLPPPARARVLQCMIEDMTQHESVILEEVKQYVVENPNAQA